MGHLDSVDISKTTATPMATTTGDDVEASFYSDGFRLTALILACIVAGVSLCLIVFMAWMNKSARLRRESFVSLILHLIHHVAIVVMCGFVYLDLGAYDNGCDDTPFYFAIASAIASTAVFYEMTRNSGNYKEFYTAVGKFQVDHSSYTIVYHALATSLLVGLAFVISAFGMTTCVVGAPLLFGLVGLFFFLLSLGSIWGVISRYLANIELINFSASNSNKLSGEEHRQLRRNQKRSIWLLVVALLPMLAYAIAWLVSPGVTGQVTLETAAILYFVFWMFSIIHLTVSFFLIRVDWSKNTARFPVPQTKMAASSPYYNFATQSLHYRGGGGGGGQW